MKRGGKIALGAAALTLALGAGYAIGYTQQPHMLAALNDLRGAQGELQSAEHDKGGHREHALDLVGRAIQQVQAGIDCGRGVCPP